MTKYAMETAHIYTTQESLHVKITNEGDAHDFLQNKESCSLQINSTWYNSQPSLLCGNIEVVMWSCVYKKAWTSAKWLDSPP